MRINFIKLFMLILLLQMASLTVLSQILG